MNFKQIVQNHACDSWVEFTRLLSRLGFSEYDILERASKLKSKMEERLRRISSLLETTSHIDDLNAPGISRVRDRIQDETHQCNVVIEKIEALNPPWNSLPNPQWALTFNQAYERLELFRSQNARIDS